MRNRKCGFVLSFFLVLFLISFKSLVSGREESLTGLRSMKDLTGPWKFSGLIKSNKPIVDPGIAKGWQKIAFDDSSWKERRVPLNWFFDNKEGNKYYLGWYRKEVFIPRDDRDKRVIVHFDGASYQTSLWINGKEAGEHIGAFAEFEFDISKYIKFGQNNLIVVRIEYDRDGSKHPLLGNYPPPAWRGGIYQPVQLLFTPPIYVKRALINPRVSSNTIDVDYLIYNGENSPQRVTIQGIVKPWRKDEVNSSQDMGTLVLKPGLNKATLRMSLKNPLLWSPNKPYLYDLFTVIKGKGSIIDLKKDRFGFREFTAKGKYLYLNGKRIYLFGAGSYGVYIDERSVARWGAANLLPKQEKQDVRKNWDKAKEMGLNLVRAWQGEPAPKFVYEAADEAGLLFYQEWASWPGNIKKKYLGQLIDEMEQWVYMVYNDPSVVMLSFKNESHTLKQTDVIYKALKSKFGDRMLFTASSGAAYLLVNPRFKPFTDFIDIHDYTGLSFYNMLPLSKRPWTYLGDSIRKTYANINKTFFAGKLNKPLIIGEYPGQWRDAYWLGNIKKGLHQGKVTPETYVAVSKTPPGGLSIAAWDLKNASLRDRLGLGKSSITDIWNKVVKHAVESLRRLKIVQGIIVNNSAPNVAPVTKMVYSPLFICSGIFNTNLFSEGTLKMSLYIINDYPQESQNLSAVIEIRTGNGKQVNSDKINIGHLQSFARKIIPYTYKIPANLPTGIYDIKLYLYVAGKIKSRNYYDLYVLNKRDLRKRIITARKVALLALPQDREGLRKTENILAGLKIGYNPIPLSQPLKDFSAQLVPYDVLIIPAFFNGSIHHWRELSPQIEVIGKIIRRWVEKGGRVLSLEQTIKGPLPWVREWDIMDGGSNWYIDMAVPGHPIYKGLVQRNFDTWNGNGGENTKYLIKPISVDLIATAATTSTDQLTMAVAEARVGKGSVLASQIEATERYMKDSVATKYIQNLLSYVLQGKSLYAGIRELKGEKGRNRLVDLAKTFYVNLTPYVNRGFKDKVAGDKKGGWTDQGVNDLRNFPVGNENNPERKYWQIVYHRKLKDKQIFLGVPFEIINPEKNNDKSAIVLSGGPRPYFPEEVTGIKIDRKATKLYFLHTAVWSPPSGLIAKYIIHYAAGTETIINLNAGEQIADWWGPRDLEDAKVAWAKKHPITGQRVGVYLFEWDNPQPEKTISTIDFVSTQVAVPVLLAITGIE